MITKLSRNVPGAVRGPRDFVSSGGGGAPPQILLIEDDEHIAQLLAAELIDVGCCVDWAQNGRGGLNRFEVIESKLVILDLNLPDVDGLTVCERIRATDRVTPILMLTARATKEDVVRGLELGADDYVTKPFDTLELIARVRALLRRASARQIPSRKENVPQAICRGPLRIDEVKRQTQIAGRIVELTAKEFELLLLFVKHPGRPFTREELLSRVWGDGFEGYQHTVNTHINRLRNKVEKNPRSPSLIETVWGVGYRFASRIGE